MKIDFIELAGFRGFRERTRFDIPGGFAVISGRNGVGKSTVCDAVEFALSGRIDKYQTEKSDRETIADYYWWRGETVAPEHFVSIGLVDQHGVRTVVTRTRESGLDVARGDIEALLCPSASGEDTIERMCRTSIIRDELIAQLSLDLSDTERFDFVSKALGAAEAPTHDLRTAALIDAAKAASQRATQDYSALSDQLGTALADVARARDSAAAAGDVPAAIAVVAPFGAAGDTTTALIREARRAAQAGRETITSLARELENFSRANATIRTIDTAEWRARVAEKESEIVQRRKDHVIAEALEAIVRDRLEEQRRADAMATALAALIRHGEMLGLDHGACPLCQSEISEDQLKLGIEAARERLGKQGRAAEAVEREAADAAASLTGSRSSLAEAEAQLEALILEIAGARTTLDSAITFFRAQLPFVLSGDLQPDAILAVVESHVLGEHRRLLEVERAIATLEASDAVQRLADAEAMAEALRRDRDAAGDRAKSAEVTLDTARKIGKAAKRASAEITDERLAIISPLLNELYQRLRPHAGWRRIDYAIRGDVRRFLSLRVGDNLNPSFVFSSGQRRAAGIAFLLSVHLSRPWCAWRTLVLDDPVQHIDDFRALQLVEVLAAMRQKDHQIICAVEDVALADMLARRLRSQPNAPGVYFELGHGSDGSAHVTSHREIAMPPAGVLRRGAGLSAVG